MERRGAVCRFHARARRQCVFSRGNLIALSDFESRRAYAADSYYIYVTRRVAVLPQ